MISPLDSVFSCETHAELFAVTPRFPDDVVPAGRCQRGEAVVFHNLAPYDAHSAVTVMSREPYVPLHGFTPRLLADAFGACQEYFAQVQRRSARVGKCTAMPLADCRWLTSFHPASHTSFTSRMARVRNEVRHTRLRRRAHSGALLSGRASAVAATPPKRR